MTSVANIPESQCLLVATATMSGVLTIIPWSYTCIAFTMTANVIHGTTIAFATPATQTTTTKLLRALLF